MKKIFTLLLLVFCLTMQAQIQRTIAGCTLGSSMSEVKSILKKNGFKIEYVDNETLMFQMSTFDGMKTESVKFCFYNDKLYDVDIYFKASTEESEMQSEFLKINEYLNSKYGNYIMHTDNNDIIKKKCVVVGAADHVEIWSEERWNAYEEEATESFESIAETLTEYLQ